MYKEDGIAFDVKPRGPSWKPHQGAPSPRIKLWLQCEIGRARETRDPDSFDHEWEIIHLKNVAAGLEPLWSGRAEGK